jgi:hypothetical protein
MSKMCSDTREADGIPKSFSLDGQKITVNRVIDRWHEGEYEYLTLLADNERIYLLRRKEGTHWEVQRVYL